MKILDNLKQAISLLQENEEYCDKLFELQEETEKKIIYWLHYIELENVPVTLSYKIIKEIKRLRQIRRMCKNEIYLMKIFRDNEQKLCNVANRKILLNQVCKTNNKQLNAQYSYDAYTEEEFNEVLGIKKEVNENESENFKLR